MPAEIPVPASDGGGVLPCPACQWNDVRPRPSDPRPEHVTSVSKKELKVERVGVGTTFPQGRRCPPGPAQGQGLLAPNGVRSSEASGDSGSPPLSLADVRVPFPAPT